MFLIASNSAAIPRPYVTVPEAVDSNYKPRRREIQTNYMLSMDRIFSSFL
jgi:hypothetical protein